METRTTGRQAARRDTGDGGGRQDRWRSSRAARSLHLFCLAFLLLTSSGCATPTVIVLVLSLHTAVLATVVALPLAYFVFGLDTDLGKNLLTCVIYYWTLCALFTTSLWAEFRGFLGSVDDAARASPFQGAVLGGSAAALTVVAAALLSGELTHPLSAAWCALAAFLLGAVVHFGYYHVAASRAWHLAAVRRSEDPWLRRYLASGEPYGDLMLALFVRQSLAYAVLLLPPVLVLAGGAFGLAVGTPGLLDLFVVGLALFGACCLGYAVWTAGRLARLFTLAEEPAVSWERYQRAFAAGYRQRVLLVTDRLHTVAVGGLCLLPLASRLRLPVGLSALEVAALVVALLAVLIALAALLPFYDGQRRQVETSLAAIRAANPAVTETALLDYRAQLETLGPTLPFRSQGRTLAAILGLGGAWAYACRKLVETLLAP